VYFSLKPINITNMNNKVICPPSIKPGISSIVSDPTRDNSKFEDLLVKQLGGTLDRDKVQECNQKSQSVKPIKSSSNRHKVNFYF
jgi:hypothetical protein